MKVGIGLPAAVRGVGRAGIVDWAQRAEQAGFEVVSSAATDAGTIRQYLAGFEAAGADDVICFPASADVSQVDRLADAAL